MVLKRLTRFGRNLLMDLRYGTFLGGVKKTPYAEMGAHDTANSDYRAMFIMFEDIVESHDVLVDVGCGKGRVLNYWLSRYPSNAIFGIELDSVVAAQTGERLRRHLNVTVIAGDVMKSIPDSASVFYLFNPFDCQVMAGFKTTLLEKFFDSSVGWKHPFKIIYYNPVCIAVFSCDSRFECEEICMPQEFHRCLLIKQAAQ